MADCAQKRRIVAHSGERHARARLTDAQVQQVRLRYGAGGITQRALAEEFGVSRSLIAGITLGKLRNAI